MKKEPIERSDYIVVAPTGRAKGYTIASKRIGGGNNYAPVAAVASEAFADKIIKALLVLQGEQVKIDTPLQRELVEVRAQLTKERATADLLRMDVRRAQENLRVCERTLSTSTTKIVQLEKDIELQRKEIVSLRTELSLPV